MTEKVLVTGGAGFVGSRLVKRLLDEGKIVCVFDAVPIEKAMRLSHLKDHANLIYTQGDLRDVSAIKRWYEADATHLYHLASVVGVKHYIDNPLALIDIVVGGTRTLLELAAEYDTRVLFTSTSEIYGKNPNTPWSEIDDRVLGPTSVDRWSYSSAKAVCEHMLFALYRSSGLRFTTVRFFNVYGPGQAPIFVASQSVHQVLNGQSPLLYDSGRQTRCFTYVDDAVEGTIRASRNEDAIGHVVNIGSNIESTISEVVYKVIELSGKDLIPELFNTEQEYGSSYEDIQRRVPAVKKALDLLGWEAETSLDDGINETIDWAKQNPWWLA